VAGSIKYFTHVMNVGGGGGHCIHVHPCLLEVTVMNPLVYYPPVLIML